MKDAAAEPTGSVYVVDDDADLRKSLKRSLTMRGFAVSCFASAAEFLEAFDPDSPCCIVLDYGMPEMDGLALQAEFNRRQIDAPIIFMTGHGGIAESVTAMKGGAIDFLEKPFRTEVLSEHIKTALALSHSRLAKRQSRSVVLTRFEHLTEREREIMAYFITNPSDCSSKAIARALDISPRTVDHHRARILEKMNVRSVAELVDTANREALPI